MEKVTETWVTAPERPVSVTNRSACLVHIYPTGAGMGARYALNDRPLVIGRGNDCEIRINDHSVSSRHARIQPVAAGYYAVDLNSTNGSYVDDVPTTSMQTPSPPPVSSPIKSTTSTSSTPSTAFPLSATPRTTTTKRSTVSRSSTP